MDRFIEIKKMVKLYFSHGFFDRNRLAVRAVDNVSLSIHRNTVFGLVGESGCGKTTLGRILVRLLEPTSGTVRFDGEDITHLEELVMDMHAAKKPVGFLCISPAMAAKIYGDAGIRGVKLTIGKDQGTADAIRAMGAEHVDCEVGDCVVDAEHKVVSTPAYMLAQRISEAADGIEKTVKKVLDLIRLTDGSEFQLFHRSIG